MKSVIPLFCILICLVFILGMRSGIDVAKSREVLSYATLEVEVTAYSPSPHITVGNPFQMASGKIARPQDLEQLRFVAISRDLKEEFGVKYGDTIYIGFQVEDLMGKKVRNTVDIFMRNLDLARKFGRQKRQIIIIRRNS